MLNVLPNRPQKTKQKDVFKLLLKINNLRNRIAHHEPICFDGTTMRVAQLRRRYQDILDMLEWLGCNKKKLLYGIDHVPQALALIEKIITPRATNVLT